MPGTMPGMATTRKGTAQPFARGKARQPGGALAAALAGKAVGAANPQDQDRQLAKGATANKLKAAATLADVLANHGGSAPMPGAAGAMGGASANGMRRIPQAPKVVGMKTSDSLADSIKAPQAQKRAAGERAPMAARKRAYVNGGQDRTNAAGEKFKEFTVDGMPGTYHEYVDPKTGNRKVRYVRKAVQTA